MKKTICNIRTLAALLVAGAAFTACSNEDNYVEEAPQYYTMTVNATKDANTTRALSLADPSSPLTSALNATWTEGDEVTVTKGTTPVGTLTASNITNSGKTATFSGQIDASVQANDVLTLTYHPVAGLSAFSNQNGTLASASNLDVAVATVTVTDVTGGVITITGSTTFYAQTAVVQLILEDASHTPINATSLKITAAGEDVFTFMPPAATYTTNGNGILYFALPSKAMMITAMTASMTETEAATLLAMPITFTASDGTDIYTATKAQGYTFEARKYYGSTLTMTKYVPTLADVFRDGAVVTMKFGTANDEWFGVTGKYIALASTYTSVAGSGSFAPTSVSLTKDGNNLVASVTEYNTMTVTFDTTNDTYTVSATSSDTPWRMTTLNSITINGVDITSTLTDATPAPPVTTTKTWDSSNVSNLDVSTYQSYSKEGITLSANANQIYARWEDYGDPDHDGINFQVNDETGGFTFTAPSGKNFSKIEMTLTGSGGWDGTSLGTGWAFVNDYYMNSIYKVTWTGTAAPTVDLLTGASSFSGANVKSIVFTLQE